MTIAEDPRPETRAERRERERRERYYSASQWTLIWWRFRRHRAAMVAAVSGKRGKRYLKRQQLLEVGPPALEYLTEVTHRRPRAWVREVDRLHDLLQAHSPELLRDAFQRAVDARTFGAEYVDHYLQGNGRNGAHA